MRWFNKERTKAVLTFPVETMALLSKDGEMVDPDMAEFTAEMYAEGHSFFTYMSDNADSLSSCCRLRNEITDNGFSYTLGAGGVSTGSKSVLTINLNRCVQYAVNNKMDYCEFLTDIIDLCHKVQLAYNENLKDLAAHGMLPLFDAGYINIGRQYLTIGVNGLVEAAEFMGLTINDNPNYRNFVQTILGLVEKKNKEYRTKDVMFNCEMIPAENVGVKHAKWDREDGYFVPRDCYNSYFYIVEDPSISILEKFRLHGTPYIEHLTGGSALHCNLEEHLSQEQYMQLLHVAAKEGCNYFTFNIPNTICNDCGYIDKRYLKECPHCHSKNVDYMTRIIGYLKRVSNFSMPRQEEVARRHYATPKQMVES
jgi:ribonucleoside-triphosphate reductase